MWKNKIERVVNKLATIVESEDIDFEDKEATDLAECHKDGRGQKVYIL